MALWQKAAFAIACLALIAGMWADADVTATMIMALLTPAFFCVAILRAAALPFAWWPPEAAADTLDPACEASLPLYTILVPLFREAHMAEALVAALERIDWPAARREIVFITEAADSETRLALERAAGGREGMRILTVPPGAPQTKPRALMYALPRTTGAFVVVYDAEDEPEPGQLKAAADRFQNAAPGLACLQARLNIYNPNANWITRQFTLEYTALFDAILPALERLRLPVPLGGTSNHFRRDALEQVGGWDPYNVTEDADLGIRLARLGWRVEVLASTTWEEAPPTLQTWLGQRTRWLKGWMQTLLVHLREPARLRTELGPRAYLGFIVLMGGMIMSALVHPLVYAYALWKLWLGDVALWPPDGWPAVVWWAGVGNLLFAYTVAMGLAALAGARRHGNAITAQVVLMPFYWMLISLAAYRAIFDLARRPFHWRKTEHQRRTSASSAPD